MRKRYIKSVAHWVIMCFILLFPIVMVGISSFAQKQQEINVTETYQYETNDVTNVEDLVVGRIYHYSQNLLNIVNGRINTKALYNFKISSDTDTTGLNEIIIDASSEQNEKYMYFQFYSNGNITWYIQDNNYNNTFKNFIYPNYSSIEFDFVYMESSISNVLSNIGASTFLGEKTIDYTITEQTMRDDVNEWCASFRNLPVNQWYGDMLDTIGLGITTSMMMNVIYTYPLYVLWVYIIDLLVDCLLVIINFGHNALKRLGGENE